MATPPSATVEHTAEPLPTAVAEIAELARRDAERTPTAHDPETEGSLFVVKLRNDERLEERDLEQRLEAPDRARGNAIVVDPGDFVDYVNRLANTDHTTVWADVDAGTMTAVINDHATWDRAGWRDHTVQLRLKPDEDWQRWAQRDGKLTGQADFAEFIEDVAHTVIRPDAATMVEVATTMHAKRSVEFSEATRINTGDVQLKYTETTDAKAGQRGQTEIPERITVQLSPWRGVIVAELEARLRWRIVDGRLAIGYKLLRPDMFRSEVFEGLVEKVRGGLDVGSLYLGATPASLRT